MSVVLGLVVGAVTVLFLLVVAAGVLRAPVLARRNYRDRAVPTAGGLLIVLALLVIEAGRALLGAAGIGDDPGLTTARSLVLFAAFGFGLLGLIDDAVGEGDDRGFRGHVGALFQGRLTTGMLKLVGGGAVAVVLVAAPGDVTGWRLLADALLIALAANLGNLLDRAPGRAIKVGVVVYLPLALALGTGAVGVAIAPVIGAAVGLLGPDLRERIMLGDTGANVIGAVLGLGVVLGVGPTTRTVVLVVVAALNVTAELVSFSRVIERVPALRAFDQLGRAA
jgi:UDP-GlcNAc:undecaprenyl-phosphate/decaprenyl-phosphate GlcNAc-1-phosphate transferase